MTATAITMMKFHRMSVHILECTSFYSERCQVSASLKNKIDNIYKKLLDEGCESKSLLLLLLLLVGLYAFVFVCCCFLGVYLYGLTSHFPLSLQFPYH